jgi:hypothetical protein
MLFQRKSAKKPGGSYKLSMASMSAMVLYIKGAAAKFVLFKAGKIMLKY